VLRLAAPVIAGVEGGGGDKGDKSDKAKLSHVGFVLTPKLLISVRYEASKAFDAVAAEVGPLCPDVSSVQIFAALMEGYVEGQADLLEAARAELDEISHRVFRDPPSSRRRASLSNMIMRHKLQALGRVGERISIIRESLLGMDRALAFAGEAAKDWFTGEPARRLKAVRDDLSSLALFEEHLLGKVQFLLDAVLGFISIEQNDIFKVLTIVSVVGIFPTLVVGWYGMNFQNIAEFHWRFGYQWGITMVLVSTIAPLLWFKWRGWM
jgi:magnesium transporter